MQRKTTHHIAEPKVSKQKSVDFSFHFSWCPFSPSIRPCVSSIQSNRTWPITKRSASHEASVHIDLHNHFRRVVELIHYTHTHADDARYARFVFFFLSSRLAQESSMSGNWADEEHDLPPPPVMSGGGGGGGGGNSSAPPTG